MAETRTISIMLSIPKMYRDLLRRIAAKKNIKNPDENTTVSGLSRKIICEYLDQYLKEGKE